jgi:hypothetical protein
VTAEWALLAESSADIEVDPDVFVRENLERLAFFDNEETDTQVCVCEGGEGAGLLALLFVCVLCVCVKVCVKVHVVEVVMGAVVDSSRELDCEKTRMCLCRCTDAISIVIPIRI